MGIMPLTAEEFGSVARPNNKRTPFTKAVRGLEAGTGFQTLCVFNHSRRSCHGSSIAWATANSAGFDVRTRCKDGTLYIFRPEE